MYNVHYKRKYKNNFIPSYLHSMNRSRPLDRYFEPVQTALKKSGPHRLFSGGPVRFRSGPRFSADRCTSDNISVSTNPNLFLYFIIALIIFSSIKYIISSINSVDSKQIFAYSNNESSQIKALFVPNMYNWKIIWSLSHKSENKIWKTSC